MPISSFHGLKDSAAQKPWTSTKSSQKNRPRSPSGAGNSPRKKSLESTPIWERRHQDSLLLFENKENGLKNSRNRVQSSTDNARKGYRKISLRSTEFSRPRSARNERSRLTRRDTFPNFTRRASTNENCAKRPTREYTRSKTDPLINLEKRNMKDNVMSPRRPSTLWMGKRERKVSLKVRGNKVNNGVSSPSRSSPEPRVLKRLSPGERVVCILNKKPQLGLLKFVGTTHFAEGEWCGIILDERCGKNDGSVRGVRYFRCKNKHGIFVHSHKVKTADETTLSKLNLLDSCNSPLAEKQDNWTLKSGDRNERRNMASSDAKTRHCAFVEQDFLSCACYDSRAVNSRNPIGRRSMSLDRYLFIKAKQLSKGLNMLSHTEKGDKTNTCANQNGINRSLSLPKIINVQDSFIETMAFYDASEKTLRERNVLLAGHDFTGVNNEISAANGSHEDGNDDKIVVKSSGNLPTVVAVNGCEEVHHGFCETVSDDRIHSLNESDHYPAANHEFSVRDSVVNKVVHAVSLDTHLRVKNGQLVGVDSNKETLDSQETNKEDAFIQGRHCSCPCLHSADHFSKAITTCIDLGRAERPSTPQPGETDKSPSDGQAEHIGPEGVACRDGKNASGKPKVESKALCCAHSHSEILEKILRTAEDSRRKSLDRKSAILTRVGSWPQLVLIQNQCLKSHGSSGDIGGTGITGLSSWGNIDASEDDDVFEGSSFQSDKRATTVEYAAEVNDSKSTGNIPTNTGIGPSSCNVLQSKPVESNKRDADRDESCADSLSGSQASLSSSGTTDNKGNKKKLSSKKTSSVSKTKPQSLIGVSNSNTAKASQQKQSRTEQLGKMNRATPSVKGQVNSRTSGNLPYKNDGKIIKRHTLSTLQDAKPQGPTSRPSLSKRPVSGGVNLEISSHTSKERAKPSKLPVKKMMPPIQSSKPAAISTVEKESTRLPVQQRHSSAANRPPVTPVVKKSSVLVSSEQNARKVSAPVTVLQKSVVKGKVGEQKVTVEPTPTGLKGQKGAVAPASRMKSSRVVRSSSSVTAKSQAGRDTKTQHSLASSKPIAANQTAKGNARQTSSTQRHGTSKLPRKVSALSNVSDNASVTSSSRDHTEDFDDTVSVSTEASEHDGGLPQHRHLGQDSQKFVDIDRTNSDQVDADQRHGICHKLPVEVLPRAWPLAPDILSETPFLSRQSVGVQVDDKDHLDAVEHLQEKWKQLDELLGQRTDLYQQLQKQVKDTNVNILAASLVIFSIVRKLNWSHKYTNQLQRKIESTLQEMKEVKERLVEEEANNIKLQEEMMYQSSEHAVAMETLKADYDNVLEQTSLELKEKHAGEITLAIETHKAHVNELKQQHEKEVEKLKQAHDEFVQSLKEEHRDEIVELESSHSSAIDELVEEHQVEIETIKAEYGEQHSSLKAKSDRLTSECSALNKKVQSLQEENQKDVEARIQEAIKQYETLPAELESIKAVLEMKNAEIKTLRKEKMEKHLELEKAADFNTQMQKLQHENESLSFVVETKSKFERQLSVERDTLKSSLEKEAAKSKRLSLENEELQWRLFNNTSPVSSPADGSFSLSMPNRKSFHLSSSCPDVDPLRTIDE